MMLGSDQKLESALERILSSGMLSIDLVWSAFSFVSNSYSCLDGSFAFRRALAIEPAGTHFDFSSSCSSPDDPYDSPSISTALSFKFSTFPLLLAFDLLEDLLDLFLYLPVYIGA